VILFISAKQGGGKTELTNKLKEKFLDTSSLKFADPLYQMHHSIWDAIKSFEGKPYHLETVYKAAHDAAWGVLAGYGMQPELISPDLLDYLYNTFKKTPESPREKKSSPLLQFLGTEFGRKRDTDIWVNLAKNKAAQLLKTSQFVAVDDGRFENEFHAFPQSLKIRLECDRDLRKARCDAWRDDEFHPSEIGLDEYSRQGKFDYYIDTGTNDRETTLARAIQFITARINHFPTTQGDYESIVQKFYSGSVYAQK
jgi:hypothetical protein